MECREWFLLLRRPTIINTRKPALAQARPPHQEQKVIMMKEQSDLAKMLHRLALVETGDSKDAGLVETQDRVLWLCPMVRRLVLVVWVNLLLANPLLALSMARPT